MKLFFKILIAIILVAVVVIAIALIVSASIQDVSPAVQWQNWMELLGLVSKTAESSATAGVML